MEPFDDPDWIVDTTTPIDLEEHYIEAAQTPKRRQKSPSSVTSERSDSELDRSAIAKIHQRRLRRMNWLVHGVVATIALLSGMATTLELGFVELLERQTQTLFWQFRSPQPPPENVVILAIDEISLEQGKRYEIDPTISPDAKDLKTWPWPRSVYATVIDRLMQSGARAIAIDLVFDSPSLYGPGDDQQLRRVLQKYPGKITLAVSYEDDETRPGHVIQLVEPDPVLLVPSLSIGSISYLVEQDGRIHQFTDAYPAQWLKNNPWMRDNPGLVQEFRRKIQTAPSLERAVLKAAGLSFPDESGQFIFFYGPPETFPHIPFAEVFDRQTWSSNFQGGTFFKDKIVLIGPTAKLFQDHHRTPVSGKMPGIEINANAVATLLEGRAIATAIPIPALRGLLALVLVGGMGYVLSQRKSWLTCLVVASGSAIGLYGLSYVMFFYGRLLLPIPLPALTIVVTGGCYGVLRGIQEIQNKRQLRRTFKRYVSAPIVQEIIAQQDDLQDLIQESDREIMGRVLKSRYKIIKALSSGGFGATYLAEDTQRPGNPRCVVKQLRPLSNNPKVWQVAKRLFVREAETLEVLGKHDQIPQLLAYFEEDEEFYVVEEWIIGNLLSHEMSLVIPNPEVKTLVILQDLLNILAFIHSYNVIHRDLKPDNIIRRHADQRLVLIDFGAVKEIQEQFGEGQDMTKFTMAIGTKGYTPSEQAAGKPQFASDLYALGVIAIQILTGLHPRYLNDHPDTGELDWQGKAKVSPALIQIVTKMVRVNVRERYQTAAEVLADLQPLLDKLQPEQVTNTALTIGVSPQEINTSKIDDSTVTWETDDDDEVTEVE